MRKRNELECAVSQATDSVWQRIENEYAKPKIHKTDMYYYHIITCKRVSINNIWS